MNHKPVATYRLQLCPDFGFSQAKDVLVYLRDLGISDIYASPISKAANGSTHGYDVVDHTVLNPELGEHEDFDRLMAKRKSLGLGWIQDIVPNHCAFSGENGKLMDVLENGPASEYYNFFDIEWNHPYEVIRGRLLAPFLGKFYAQSLEQGEIKLAYDSNGFSINYYQLRFPLKIESYVMVLTHNISKLKETLGDDHPDYLKLLGVVYILKNLPGREQLKERGNQILFVKKMLFELYTTHKDFEDFIAANLQAFNGVTGNAESFNLLDQLLSEQVFRLAFWKVGTEEINYRRFFAINGLICVRVEDKHVFDLIHSLPLELIKKGHITGLRVDHIDGLWDPAVYLRQLRTAAGPIYLAVEKILGFAEYLPENWPVEGTTGYDFLNFVNGLFCEQRNQNKFVRIYAAFAGIRPPYDFLVHEMKRLIIRTHMTADIDNLALFIKHISGNDRYGKDITLHGLRRGLVEVLTMLPVYRTYISHDYFLPSDKVVITAAIEQAKANSPELQHEIDFLERFLLLKFDGLPPQQRNEWINFVMRFQQFSGPLMAKGYEDTMLYKDHKLISLNEVGSNISYFGISPTQYHKFNSRRNKQWPHTINATTTHDTKRGEDVRARINVLSEIPALWARHVRLWRDANMRKKPLVNGIRVPDRNDEYFLYQTLVGVYPFTNQPDFADRLKNYIIKAVREAKTHTEWIKPDSAYETAFLEFIDALLSNSNNEFLSDFIEFQKYITWYGMFNSLGQVLLKITSPGLPDFYQGTELWDLSMVDPDNRRPVDYAMRKKYLADIKAALACNHVAAIEDMFSNMPDGRIKMFTIMRALETRSRFVDVYENGKYIPLKVSGAHSHNIVAFARTVAGTSVITVVPRFLTQVAQPFTLPIGEIWSHTQLELPSQVYGPKSWANAFTNETFAADKTVPVCQALRHFPVAMLVGESK